LRACPLKSAPFISRTASEAASELLNVYGELYEDSNENENQGSKIDGGDWFQVIAEDENEE